MLDISAIPLDQPLRIALGAGDQRWDGWIPTQKDQLDLTRRADWVQSFGDRRIDALLCEHVWEHLTDAESRAAAAICFEFLKPGGFLRCAVPDGNFPDEDYQRLAQVGGPGPADHPAADHKILYTYGLFMDVFASAGFIVDLLEYCDEAGRFHYNQWDYDAAPVYRSFRTDHRNQGTALRFVSLIVDAIKPGG